MINICGDGKKTIVAGHMCKTEDTRGAAGGNTTPSSASGGGKGGRGLEAAPLATIATRLQEGEEAREESEREEYRVKRTSELWQIHGKHFDLSGFLGQHPVRELLIPAYFFGNVHEDMMIPPFSLPFPPDPM